MITVVNRHHGAHPRAVYAGRGSAFGNPFPVGPGRTRAESMEAFKIWFTYAPDAIHARLAAGRLTDDAALECSCVPLACHAQVIADFENRRRGFID